MQSESFFLFVNNLLVYFSKASKIQTEEGILERYSREREEKKGD